MKEYDEVEKAWHQCGRKRCLPTEQAAAAIAAETGYGAKFYRCPRCNWWHLTGGTLPGGKATGSRVVTSKAMELPRSPGRGPKR